MQFVVNLRILYIQFQINFFFSPVIVYVESVSPVWGIMNLFGWKEKKKISKGISL